MRWVGPFAVLAPIVIKWHGRNMDPLTPNFFWITRAAHAHSQIFMSIRSTCLTVPLICSGTVRWPVALALKEVQIRTSIAYKAINNEMLHLRLVVEFKCRDNETKSYLDK